MTAHEQYVAFGKINDGTEQGKSCLIIADSVDEIRKMARDHEVYEISYACELPHNILITYSGMGTGLRVWPPSEDLNDILKGKWYEP
jgi:hypothetical protein